MLPAEENFPLTCSASVVTSPSNFVSIQKKKIISTLFAQSEKSPMMIAIVLMKLQSGEMNFGAFIFEQVKLNEILIPT